MLAPGPSPPDHVPIAGSAKGGADLPTLEAWLPLVAREAIRLQRRLPATVDPRDLIGAGTLGLIDAIRRYDPRRCDRFAPYATLRVRGAMLDELRAMDWVPRSVRAASHRLEDARHRALHKPGRAPEPADLLPFSGIPERAWPGLCRDVVDETVLAADESRGPEREVGARERGQRLAAALACLPERDRQVIRLYYVEELRLKQIGELIGVSESRACQLHAAAIARLRGLLAADDA